MYQSIVFFDLDGTLLNLSAEIPNQSILALNQLRQNGHLPVIATGRPYSLVKEFINDGGFDTVVLMNGQYVKHRDQVIYDDVINPKLVKRLYDFSKDRNFELAYYNDQHHAVNQLSSMIEDAFGSFGIETPLVNKTFHLNNKINQMVLFSQKESYDDLFRREFPDLSFFRTSDSTLDVVRRNNSKAEGIKRLVNHLGITLDNTYAFGDQSNDIEMLKLIPNSVAMGNAIESVKQIAKLIVASNDEGGIIEGPRHYNLIKQS